jgi:hypothetical protein
MVVPVGSRSLTRIATGGSDRISSARTGSQPSETKAVSDGAVDLDRLHPDDRWRERWWSGVAPP